MASRAGNIVDNPRVTIGLSVKNNEDTIEGAIRSIQMQSLTDWRLVVVIDGSTDGTADQVRRIHDERIVVTHHSESRGLPARLNEIIDTLESPYFARMDGDDFSYPQRLERQISLLESDPTIDLVGAGMLLIDEDNRVVGKRVPPSLHSEIVAKPLANIPIAHPTFVGRSDFFRRFRYREDLLRSQDQDLLFRAHEVSTYANIQEILYAYRDKPLTVRAQYEGRRYRIVSLSRELRQRGKFVAALGAIGSQVAKLSFECASIVTGTEDRMLRHRRQAVTPVEIEEWKEVLRTIEESRGLHGQL